MFRSKTISPYNVEDKATFRNVDRTLVLYVRSDATSLVVGLKQAQDKLKELIGHTPLQVQTGAALGIITAVVTNLLW